MTTCGRCGHTIEVGRFCTHCGAPVDAARTDTAERPGAAAGPGPGTGSGRDRAPGPPPPPLPPPPSSARYPLFADEVEGGTAPGAPSSYSPPPPPPRTPAERTPPDDTDPGHLHDPELPSHRSPRRGTGLLVGLSVLALLVVVALGGAVLLLSDGDGDGDGGESARDATSSASTPRSEGQDGGTSPEDPGSEAPAQPATPGGVADVASSATARVPSTRAPGTAVDGSRIRFDAEQMLDGDATTSWQMEGDGTGAEIVLTLAGPTALSEVGLINGYAKVDRDRRGRRIDWYAGNRRILAVEWVLDDGTTIAQTLDDTTELQSVPVEAVETSTVTLRLVEVSPPGKGRDARNNTAISEIALLGAVAG